MTISVTACIVTAQAALRPVPVQQHCLQKDETVHSKEEEDHRLVTVFTFTSFCKLT